MTKTIRLTSGIKKREIYIEKIRPFINKDIIKVLVWQRRVWKSYILLQIIEELKSEYKISENDIIYINMELNEFDNIRDYNDLLKFIKDKSNWKEKTYVFIDEIQDVLEFEKALRDLQALWNYDIYISGSNAKLLSSDIATYLTWRYIQFEVYPLTYKEFLDFHELSVGKDSFLSYMKVWWLPYLIQLGTDETITTEYVKSIFNTILFKDVLQRYQIRNTSFLEDLIKYISDNIWNLTTPNNIAKYLKSQKIEIWLNSVNEYIKYLCSVFLINKVQRQEIIGKKIFEINDKYYFSDIWIRNMLVWWYRTQDIWKILENIVFLHFKTLWYQVFVWKNGDKEIDFVVEKSGDKKYIQVAYLLDEEIQKREFENLLAIPDNYEKMVLTLDDFAWWDRNWIKCYNIIDYLTK